MKISSVRILFFTVSVLMLSGCEKHNTSESEILRVIANKQYSNQNRVQQCDSAYWCFFTSSGKDSLKLSIDTLFRKFKAEYADKLCGEMNRSFSELFLNDTLCQYDFINKDYFGKRFELNLKRLQALMIKMDSVKNEYLSPRSVTGSYRSVTPGGDN